MSKKKISGKWILLPLVLPVIYVAVQLFMILHSTYQTQTAVLHTLSDSITCDGALGMSETEIPYSGAGVLGYIAQNGERVIAGNKVAEVFPSRSEAQSSAYARLLTDEIDALQKSQANSSGADVELLLGQTYTGVYDVLDAIETGNYTDLRAAKLNTQQAVCKIQIATKKAENFTARVETLTQKRDAALAAGVSEEIVAPTAGYFVAGEDSLKRLYTTQQLSEMSPLDFAAAVKKPSPQCEATVAGKLIEDYKWRYFASVSIKQAAKFSEGAKVSISFAGQITNPVPATVVSIVTDEENNLAKVELVCDYINSDVVALEHTQATITFKEYEGIRIDKRALRIKDGVNGVFIKYGNVAYFRRIQILFENDTYMLVPLTVTAGENEVRLYDEIIVAGKNLEDKKIL